MAVPHNLVTRRSQLSALNAWARHHVAFILGALVFVVALGLRVYRLDAQSLWLDEGGTWHEVTSKSWPALLGELVSEQAAYPLYHLLLKAWISLAGDSEWALRLPSALAGAATALVVYLAAREIQGKQQTTTSRHSSPLTVRLLPSFLLATSPFALWHAQDAKVYSLLMLAVALQLWVLLRALRRPTRRVWALALSITILSLFVHRLALLSVAAVALAYVIVWPTNDGQSTTDTRHRSLVVGRWPISRIGLMGLALALAGGGVAGTILAVRGESRAAGGHIPAEPLQALWLTFVRFSLDRWPGDVSGYLGLPLAVWLLPFAVLTLWGLALLARDALARCPAAVAILGMFGVPLGLLALALALMEVPIYEARYATMAFPAWVLVLAYPFIEQRIENREQKRYLLRFSLFFVLCSLFLANALLLFQPAKGLFSGDPVKEQWRDAIGYLVQRAHPDDLIILHPYYVDHLWAYYAPRVTADPLPPPVVFADFKEGYFEDLKLPPRERDEVVRRTYEPAYHAAARGRKRALLLIAPDHARTVDPPPTPLDRYGWVGLRFQYSEQQNTWPCGGSGDQYIGVEVMCQSYPETFKTGAIPQPTTPLDAIFGGELHLRGYSLDLFGGAARPGGTLPVTLYWDAAAPPTRDYRMFLHLCRDCSLPPLANDDAPPLAGRGDAGHTTTWRPGDPVHDERALVLPASLPPGRYTLLLGVYPEGDWSEQARLPVLSRAEVIGGTRLVLGEIAVGQS